MRNRRYMICFIALVFCFPNTSFAIEDGKGLRVVSLAPSTTEILFALGLDDEVAGVSQSCDYPPKALSKNRVGTFSEPNIEKILSLKPDIIFCTGLEQGPAIQKMRQLNLKVIVSDPSNLNELFGSIRMIGKAVGRQERADKIIMMMARDIDSVKRLTAGISENKRPKVYVEIWHSPLMTAGGKSFINELVYLAGGINIANDISSAYAHMSPEEVVKRNPDVIILAYMGDKNPAKSIGRRLGWDRISAVRNGRVYNDIDANVFLRPGPRLVEGLTQINKRLYTK